MLLVVRFLEERERESKVFALLYQTQVKFLSQPHTRTFTYQPVMRGDTVSFSYSCKTQEKERVKKKRKKKLEC